MGSISGIKVFSPASVANFGVGKHILSVAVDQPGDVIVAKLDTERQGIFIEEITGYKLGLSNDPDQNSISLSARYLLEHLSINTGISMRIKKGIPLHSGFSSNASSAVAGVFAVNELLGRPVERYDLLPFASRAASHFDMVAFPAQTASALYGGIILHGMPGPSFFRKIYAPHGLRISLVMPVVSLDEREKWQVWKKYAETRKFSSDSGQISSMISALYTSDLSLLSESLRSAAQSEPLADYYPYYHRIRQMVQDKGALGCGLAGLGPGMFILSPNTLVAENTAKELPGIFRESGIEYELVHTSINLNGVFKY